ncbi:MAG: PD-(D/E)XK nuclease family protein [Melioribacteraceae bacterium]|nr:PD-(D/E)XK nuclease family protein [Melioribacteraceae bacterium]
MILSKENIAEINIDELIQNYLESGKIEKILFIVPTNRKSRQLKKQLFDFAKNKSAQKIKIETLETISEKLLSVKKIFHHISEAASIIFIKRSIEKVKLNYYSNFRDEIPNGTIESIRNYILELKRNCIPPEQIENDDEIIEETEKLKAQDISNIYREYKSICKSIDAFDLGDIYENLLELTETDYLNSFNEFYYDIDFIFVDGFNQFATPEINIIKKLSNCKKLFISIDYFAENEKIFFHLKQTYEKLIAFGFSEIKDKRIDDLNKFRKILHRGLFRTNQVKKQNYANKIFELYGNKKEDEVELIASEIKKIIIEENEKPSNICVAFNLIQEYSEIVRDIFEKYGLPLNITDRKSLDKSQPIISIINFLEIIETDYYYQSLYRALNSNYVSINNIDITNLQLVAQEFKIISGKNNWIDALKIENLENDEETKLTDENIKKAKEDFVLISDLLSPFEKKLTIKEFIDNLIRLIIELKIPFNILSYGKEENNSRALSLFIENVKEVFELLEKEENEKQTYSIDFYLNQLRTLCNWARYNLKEKSNYGILVTTLEEIRGLNFNFLFIGGMVEGLMPTKYSPQVFRASSFKNKIKEHYSEEKYLFYKAITSFKKKLFLSYHLTTNKSEVVKSNFLTELSNLVDISVITSNSYSDILFTNEKAQINYKLIPTEKNIIEKSVIQNAENAIDIYKIRSKTPPEKNIYNGFLINEKTENDVINHFKTIKEKQFSVTQLERYAACPFKYFLENILDVKKIEEPTEEIEPIEMGRVLHKILFEFYTQIRKEKIVIQNSDDETFNKAKKILIEIANKNVDDSIFKSPLNFYEKEKILGIENNFENSILYQFLIEERKPSEFIPKYFEVAFGKLKKDGSDEDLISTKPIEVDDIKIGGKIDRIEINEKAKSFNVVDYKLGGKKPTKNDLKDGISLQLPFYLYATKELLKQKFEEEYFPNQMIIYSLKYKQENFGKDIVALSKEMNISDVINNTISYIKNYVESISNAEFNLSKLKNREQVICKYCGHRLICRVDDLKNEPVNEIENEE